MEGGFCQLAHGRPEALRRMSRGDWIAYYSGRDSLEGKTPCQRFTAIGKIAGEDVYQVTLGERFRPFRRERRLLPGEGSRDPSAHSEALVYQN